MSEINFDLTVPLIWKQIVVQRFGNVWIANTPFRRYMIDQMNNEFTVYFGLDYLGLKNSFEEAKSVAEDHWKKLSKSTINQEKLNYIIRVISDLACQLELQETIYVTENNGELLTRHKNIIDRAYAFVIATNNDENEKDDSKT